MTILFLNMAKTSRKSRKQPQSSSLTRSVNIPPYRSDLLVTNAHYRYRTTGGHGASIQALYIGQSLGAMAATTTSVYPLFSHFRIRKVEIWGFCGASPPGTLSLEWTPSTASGTGNFNSGYELSDTSLSTSFPTHISTTPPPNSQAAFWQRFAGNTTVLFNLSSSDAMVVDLYVDMVLQDDGTAGAAITVAAATVGAVYYQPLDGDGGALVAVSKTTI